MSDAPRYRPMQTIAPNLGTCPRCGKRCYTSKKYAKRAIRQLAHPGHLNVYRCGDAWHIGHLPAAVVHGVLPRTAINPKRWTA